MTYLEENTKLAELLFNKYIKNNPTINIYINNESGLANCNSLLTRYPNKIINISWELPIAPTQDFLNSIPAGSTINFTLLFKLNISNNNLFFNYYINTNFEELLPNINSLTSNSTLFIKVNSTNIDIIKANLTTIFKLSTKLPIVLLDDLLDYLFNTFKSLYFEELTLLKNLLNNDGVPIKLGNKLKKYLTTPNLTLFLNIKFLRQPVLNTKLFIDLMDLTYKYIDNSLIIPLFKENTFEPINIELLNYILTAQYPVDFENCNLCKYTYLCSNYSMQLNKLTTKDILFNNCIELKKKYDYLTMLLNDIFNFKLIIED